MAMNERLSAARPHVRPWLRRASIVAFAVLLPVAVHQACDYVEVQRLVGELRAIEARHEPTRDPDAGAIWPGPGDAGTYYAAAALVGFDRDGEALRRVETLVDGLEGNTLDRDALAAERPHFERLAATYADAFALADEAAAMRYDGTPELAEPVAEGLGQSVARLLAARTVGLALQDRGDEALASAESAVAARRARREAWFFAGQREIAAVLSLSTPSAAALQRTQAALEARDRPDREVSAFLRARGRYIDRDWNGLSAPRRLAARHVGGWLWRPWVTHQTVAALRVWARRLEIVRLPWPERIKAADRERRAEMVGGTPGAWVPWLVAVTGAVPPAAPGAFDFFAATYPKPLIIDRCARLALSVERYRRDHRGELPRDLAALVPVYLGAIPADPYTGTALRYRSTAASYTVYSVGDDGRDDDGDLSSEQARVDDSGTRVVSRGRDVGLRVWLR